MKSKEETFKSASKVKKKVEAQKEKKRDIYFMYVGPLKKVTSIVGIITKNEPFKVNKDQIKVLEKLDTFKEVDYDEWKEEQEKAEKEKLEKEKVDIEPERVKSEKVVGDKSNDSSDFKQEDLQEKSGKEEDKEFVK